tara:strand:- start:31 stop:693 length:663 start_codon:yes stop_codon:yes gene_type:complete
MAFFVVIVLVVFQDKVNGLYDQVTKEGRGIKVGNLIEISQSIKNTEIQTFASQDLSIESVQNNFRVETKGGGGQLQLIKENIENSNLKNIDALRITSDKIYIRELLLDYVSTLGVKYILFENNGQFDGWMSSSIFSGQLLETEGNSRFRYNKLKNEFAGLQNDQIKPETKTSEVLKTMKAKGLDDIAVVEDGMFKYMINKQVIINELVANALLTAGEKDD